MLQAGTLVKTVNSFVKVTELAAHRDSKGTVNSSASVMSVSIRVTVGTRRMARTEARLWVESPRKWGLRQASTVDSALLSPFTRMHLGLASLLFLTQN